MGSADTRYIDLERKLHQARVHEYSIINLSTGVVNPYEAARQGIIRKFYQPGISDDTKKLILDEFERYSENLRFLLGL